eukprot:14619264-Alexandrium_andersonii.AAC.1
MPVRRQTPIAALPSAYTRRPAEKPRSRAIETMPIPSAAPFTMPASSASPELSASVFCVEDQRLTVCPPHADPSARGAPGAQAPREVR